MRIVKFLRALALASLLASPGAAVATDETKPPSSSTTRPDKAPTNLVNTPEKSAAIADVDLPSNVVNMRDLLLAAARGGRIDEIRTPFEWNELPPTLAETETGDPIAHLKSISADGEGAEVLANLLELLSLPPTKLHLGRDLENSAVYVWPYLSELPLKNLTPRQKVELFAITPPDVAQAILKTGRWSWWRLTIGADGTWHSFMKHEH